ncbi:MAG: hypothetical protein ACTSVV_15795 [Promethearchaeota archaeon]
MAKEKKKKKRLSKEEQKLKEEQILRIMKRLESEDKEKERVRVEAKLIAADPNEEGVNVKIKAQILDPSFYAKAAKLYFNAGTENFVEADMEKIDMDNFAVILSNIPKEIQILYYIKILDKSGEWTQFPRPELIDPDDPTQEYEPYYSFSVEPDGTISFKKLWDDSNLIKCPVCGYMCQKSWKTCPECNTPLYDPTQEVFIDDQLAKEKALEESQEDELSWEDATDEEWRTLPECPSCGYTVQLDWAKCPVCNFDLTTVELKKKASYEEFMTEEEKAEMEKMSEIKKKKEKNKKKKDKEKSDEDIWESEEGIDIL